MPRATYGSQVKARVLRLFEALISFVNYELDNCDNLDLRFNWQNEDSANPKLVVKTKLRVLEVLTQNDKYDGQLTKTQIREALLRMGDFLAILEDNRVHDRGSEDWHFTLTLWSKNNKAENLKLLDKEWERRRPGKSKLQEASATAEQMLEVDPLEQLTLDSQSIVLINRGLEFAELMYRTGKLSKKQEEKFNFLKREVQSLMKIDAQLKEVAKNTQRFVVEMQQTLELEIQKLSSVGQAHLKNHAKEILQLGLEKHLGVVKQLEKGLEAGKEAAQWLDMNQRRLVQRACEAALAEYPDIKSATSRELIDDFDWDINQYLERISLCLTLGRNNMLDEPDNLESMPIHTYKAAFNFIKTRIPKHMSSAAAKELKDCIDYLVNRL